MAGRVGAQPINSRLLARPRNAARDGVELASAYTTRRFLIQYDDIEQVTIQKATP